jgi:hypothetical protein
VEKRLDIRGGNINSAKLERIATASLKQSPADIGYRCQIPQRRAPIVPTGEIEEELGGIGAHPPGRTFRYAIGVNGFVRTKVVVCAAVKDGSPELPRNRLEAVNSA